MSKFKVGDKVICVDAVGFLVQDVEYTIKKVWDNETNPVLVEECIPSIGFDCYRADRFEKVYADIRIKQDDLWLVLGFAFLGADYHNNPDVVNNFKTIAEDILEQSNK